MKQYFFLLILFSTNIFANDDLQKAKHLIQNQTIGFTENKGQVVDQKGKLVPSVFYKAAVPGLDIYITNKGLTYIFSHTEEEKKDGENGKEETFETKWCRTDLILKNASIKKENIVEENPEKKYFNYYTPLFTKGILNVKTFGKITVKEIYPGIDWILYSNERGLKYDFLVHPNADASVIKMVYEGAGEISLASPQNISIETKLGKISEGDLVSLEKETGNTISSSYLKKKNEITFSIGEYDKTKTLLIDPPLVWSTFYGGSMLDGPRGIDVDNFGNFIVAGYTASPIFFTVNPGGGAYFQGASGGNTDVVILKFDNAGVLLWATYYGGSSSEWAWDIDADNSGNILVTGRSHSANFPTTNPGSGAFFQGALNAGQDAFIIKFNNAGVCFWSTFYGGSSVDEAFGIASDANGNFALVGCTQSTDYLIAGLLFNPGGGAYYQPAKDAIYDLFLIKFNPNCVMLWGTYYGGNSQDFFPVSGGGTSQDLVFDATGNLFVTGQTLSTNFPTANPGGGAYFQAALAGGFDAFILKFTPTCVLNWGTYYGQGAGDDVGFDTKVNTAGDLYVTGYTASSTFPTQNSGGYFQGGFSGGLYDAFILCFDNLGVRQWATYYGGNGRDIGFGSRVDSCDNYYVTGGSTSSNLFTFNPGGGSFFDGSYNGAGGYSIGDMFILKFDVNDACTWATYLGGNNDEWGEDISIDAQANVFVGGEYVTGSTAPLINPGGGAYYQATGNGNDDGAYLKFSAPTILTATTTQVNVLCNGDSTGTATVNVSGGTLPYSYVWNPTGQTTQTATGLPAGTYTVFVTDANCNQLTSQTTVTITQPTALNLSSSQTPDTCGQNVGTASVVASGGTPAYTYVWAPSAQTNATATALAGGTYTCTVTDANGCSDTAVVIVTTSNAPVASITGNNIICSGNSTTLTGNGGGTYSWSTTATTTAITVSPTTNTTYTLYVSNGSCSDTAIISVILNQTPVAAITGNDTVCAGASTTLTASGGGIYSWNTGATTTAITVTPTTNTSYTIYVSNGSCSDSSVMNVVVNPLPVVTTNPSSVTVCVGDSVVLTATGGILYQWGANPASSNPTIIYYPVGSIVYPVIVTDANGCTATGSVSITVTPPPIATVSGDTIICEGETTQLIAGTGANYSWNTSATTSAISVSPTSNTSYTVVVSSGTCSDTASINVIVNPVPTASAGTSVTITSGSPTTLTATGGGNYLWSNGATTSAIAVSPTITTTYCVQITNTGGCTDSACVTVYVDFPPCNGVDLEKLLPNAFSPNGDAINNTYCVPNNVCIQSFVLQVYDRWGEKVFETDGPNKCWDGTYKGVELNTAVFAYTFKATLSNGTEIKQEGNITLAR